jgi:nicotinate-nucleotide adenylyltransferase
MRELADYLKVPMAAPNMRIGLLGGSFNPAHEAHRRISIAALKRLGLDQVWWLVSPGNPLKQSQKAPSLGKRVAAAREAARHPKITVTGFEGATGSAYTVDTIRFLKRRYPSVDFVWLMGADNLASFHRWRSFEEIFKLVPIAVFDRPGFRLKARASRAAQRFAFAHVDESDARGLAGLVPPAWAVLTLPLSPLSSTGLRADAPKQKSKPKKAKPGKASKAAKKAAKQAAKAAKKAPRPDRKQVKKPGKSVEAAKAAKKAAKAAKSRAKQKNKKAKRH